MKKPQRCDSVETRTVTGTRGILNRQARDGSVPATVWQIGVMMLLMNISFIMVVSFSGLYLRLELGVSALSIGLIEGFCETISHLMKLFSGMVSDFFRKRKGIIIFGYLFSVLSRPVLAFAYTSELVFIAKIMERFGNGVQASPRDAIIADVAPRKRIGGSYGLKRSLAYIGSLSGGLIGIWAIQATNNNYQQVFGLASIPAGLAMLLLIFCVREPKRFDHPAVASEAPLPPPKLKTKFSIKNFKYLGSAFWILIGLNAVIMTAKINETFLIITMQQQVQSSLVWAPLTPIIFNLGAALSSYPIGLLGDKLDRIKLLRIGIIFLLLADVAMYSCYSKEVMYLGILCWGIQLGTTQNIFVSLIAEKVPEDLRGTGFGVYWLVNALAAFCADTLSGIVAQGGEWTNIFLASGLIGLLAMGLMFPVIRYAAPNRKKR
ncbi:MAG: MFS transporter [Holosporales bacterium]|jgi:sugar phosphate permease|nr:MFS transporter [Holosporales bacterium]